MLFVSQVVSQFCCDTSCTRNFKVYQLSQSTNLAILLLKQPYIARNRIRFYFLQRLRQRCIAFFKALLQLVSQCLYTELAFDMSIWRQTLALAVFILLSLQVAWTCYLV
jgi:hypothetical protein